MAETMTSHERFKRIYAHQEADRVPIADAPWPTTSQRWREQGLPEGADYREFLGMDVTANFGFDISPQYPSETVEETDDYRIYSTSWGVTMKNWKHIGSTPEYHDFTVVDPDTWQDAKQRMTPTRDRIDWARLDREYSTWVERGQWKRLNFWFGFDITHSWFIGTERGLMAFVENPEWLRDMYETEIEMNIALAQMIFDAGYEFDEICWPDDMGYKGSAFFSVETYRELIKPVHKRAIDFAHAHGAVTHLHSCGGIMKLIPELVDIGLDALNPLEVKAGMDPLAIKAEFGDQLVLHGGINCLLWADLEAFKAEMRRIMPEMKANGGYIFASDHSIPENVTLDDMREVVALAKELGSY
jgi:uroporphyrinogen decarboxylase